MRLRYITLTVALALVASAGMLSAPAHAATVDPGLTGNTQYDGWENLTASNNPGYGGFPGSGAWPSPIGSNAAGSGDAELDKVAGAAYPASEGLYFGGFSPTPNTEGGTLSVSDSTPVADLEHVVFQVEVGEAFGYDFYNEALPTLSYNGGSQALAGTSDMIGQIQDGTFTDPISGEDEPVYINTWMTEWDLSSLGAITDFEIAFTPVQHSSVRGVRLDQSDTFTASAVPTPSTLALGVAAFGGLMLRRPRRRMA